MKPLNPGRAISECLGPGCPVPNLMRLPKGKSRTSSDIEHSAKIGMQLSRPVRSVLELSQDSGPSILGEATQIARNLTLLCIQSGREPFFGKVTSDAFLVQR